MNKNNISTSRQREMIQQLKELVAYRAAREEEIERVYQNQTTECREKAAAEIARLTAQHDEQQDGVNSKYIARLETSRRKYEDEAARVHKEKAQRLESIEMQHGVAKETLELDLRQAMALAERSYDQDIRIADQVAVQAKETVENELGQFKFLRDEAVAMLKRRGSDARLPDATQLAPSDKPTDYLLKRYRENVRRCSDLLGQMKSNKAVGFVDDGWPILVFIGALILFCVSLGFAAGFSGWMWAAGGFAAALFVSIFSRLACQAIGNRQTAALGTELHEKLSIASTSLVHAKDMVDVERSNRYIELEQRRDTDIKNAREKFDMDAARMESQRRAEETRLDDELSQRESASRMIWDAEAKTCRETFPPMMEKSQLEHESTVKRLEFERDTRLAELADKHAADWAALVDRWKTGVADFAGEVSDMRAYCDERFPDFEDVDWNAWSPEANVPRALPIGAYEVNVDKFPGGLPNDDQLAVEQTKFELPTVLAFPHEPSLLIEAEGNGRDAAVRVFQRTMLSMLTALPPGKVRFTIIDPTGLGQNFSGFMHLADYDERLVTSRIWTEANHINQRLTDLTEHMENVIQKYLRNEFGSIQEYNEHAGEVAEPFQVLVVANFPANFSDEATRRLVSIATSGARCGVFTLISVDTKMRMPRNFDLADLESQANTLVWDSAKSRFGWHGEALAEFPLTIKPTPTDELTTEVIRAAGQLATDANKVEVPFETVAPPQADWWTSDSRHQIEVPLGRAGATKLQFMALGKGTSQHVLVAGKTGSGKSTLMHAMITNLSLLYSPHELQFYLVDFKKGVEFKTYAEEGLPHAKVVAIESEREFGLSVLQRLDEELQQRGDAFRAAGVQSVAAYRDANPDIVMPRLFLVVDEFQEFFVSDDKIANESSLLLDRLVRQGRAFGIHVLLGSQTLAGAYSLARSTLGQMAVRIALQCSEADAHLILSEENTAARLLNRPGEAIYNNANGLFEGNHPFQVVWLPDDSRESYLKRLADLASQRQMAAAKPIVFEGNAAADLNNNQLLARAMGGSASYKVPTAWLGSAVAIKDPTSIAMRRQSGNHLLVVGQNEELSDGVISAAMIGLTATARAAGKSTRFVVLDGGRFDSAEMNLGARMTRNSSLDIDAPQAAEVDQAVLQLYEEVMRRTEVNDMESPQTFLVIYNLARFRQLRRSEDDYGFGSFSDDEAPAKPSQQLAHILREGPAVGVHVMLWCDSFNNLNRWFERATLRDFAFRVLFQMSPTDSSNLMDSTAATQLGQFRAILYDDERGEFEKFQPYGPPTAEWLQQIARELTDASKKRADSEN